MLDAGSAVAASIIALTIEDIRDAGSGIAAL
jgi:hypothetical protein